MDKLFLKISLSLLAIISVHAVQAQQVSKEVALKKAQSFLNKNMSNRQSTKIVTRQSSQLELANNSSELFVFNDEINGGYVVISGDERMPDVLGYSYNGHYDEEEIPCNMRAWLEGYAEQVKYLQSHPEAKAATRNSAERTPISPMLTCEWDQLEPYNRQCPFFWTKRCPTGCGPTAMAQIMYYHQWPLQTTKAIPGYMALNGEDIPDIPITTIDWNNILPKYDGNYYLSSQADAVATLMKLCGVAAKVQYLENESSTTPEKVITALYDYFNYSKAFLMHEENYDYNTWLQIMYDELADGFPIIYTGQGWRNEGHSFILDGYDKNDYFHVNWGWSGANNGYFTLTCLQPNDKGNYSDNQRAIVNIRPLKSDTPVLYSVFDNGAMTVYFDGNTNLHPDAKPWSPDSVSNKEDLTSFTFDSSFANYPAHLLYSLNYLFYDCKNLQTITGLDNLNTSFVTSMHGMFYGCSSLKSLDLSHFDTSNVINMSLMFAYCSNLSTIYANRNWNENSLETEDAAMLFLECPELIGGMGTTYDYDNVDIDYAHIDGGPENPGYFTYKESTQVQLPVSEKGICPAVYSLNGIKVRAEGWGTEGLPAGIYLVGGKKKVVK